jgi:hypothetical protein
MTYLFRFVLPALAAILLSLVCHAQSPDEICRVGSIAITSSELQYRERVDSIDYGRAQPREQALKKLIGDALERAALASVFHVTPPDSALRQRVAWVDSTTKNPIGWNAEKRVFMRDTQSFYSVLVSSMLVNPRLHALFAADTDIQRNARDSIEKIWAAVSKDPSQFYQFPFDTLTTPKHIGKNKSLAAMGVPQNVSDPLSTIVLSRLRPGGIWRHIIEDDYSYKIVALISENDSEYRSLVIVIAKAPFDPWFRSYVQRNIPVAFSDKRLEADLRKAYPDLWWLKSGG